MVRIGYISAGEPAHCGYNSCDEINNQTDYDECVTCTQTYCEGLCANSSCDLTEDQVTFIVGNYTCSYGNWLPASCGQNALLNWALEGDTAQFKDVLSTARWRRTIDCPNMGHSYAFENPGGKNVKMAGVTAKDIGFFHEIAAELPAGKDGDDYSSWRFFNYGESNIIKGVGFPGIPSGQIPAGGTTCYTKVTIRNILGIHDCLVIDDPPNIVETFYIDQNLQIQPNQKSGCGELAMLKSLLPNRNSQKNYKDLPYELKTVLKTVKFSHKFATSRWEIDTVNRSMTIYTYGIRDEQEMNSFDGRTVNNYTIRMVHDSEFETTVQDVKKHITKFQENPDFQINRISMVTDPFGDPPANYVELWVNQLTSKNKELDNTMIDGWIIQVYPEFK